MFYEENRHLEEEDMGYDTPIHQITLYDKSFLIAIGKERRLIQKKNTYYFPIYLLNRNQVQTQIGAFEFESSKDTLEERQKPFIDSSGDIDPNRLGDPVLYSFADYDYFQALVNTITPMGLKEMEAEYISKKAEENKELNNEDTDEDTTENARPFELSSEDIKPPSESVAKTNKVLQPGVFTIDKTQRLIQQLPEETKETARQMREAYTETGKNSWIEKFMKNNQYAIINTMANGDCLFDTVRMAYEQIGYETSIQKLRAIVAKEVTKERFAQYRELYESTLNEIAETEKELRRLVSENKNMKERLAAIPKEQKDKRNDIIRQANEIKEQHSYLKKRQILNREFLEEFAHLRTISTVDQFREYVQSPSYWADDWAIGVLERELNMKLIIFSEKDYDENDENNVLRCTLGSDMVKDRFTPDFYIMTTYSGDHYRLVSYSNKRILTFREIPYDTKSMIIIRCMESGGGVFSQIPEFIDWKRRLGVDDDDTDDADERLKGHGLRQLDTSTILTFYDKSNGSHRPGKASHEKINSDKIHEYKHLMSFKDWRKKLDDDWASTFQIDGKKWKTVEHYYQAAKFKKHSPHFYNQFSLDDASSDIATDVTIAKAAGSQKGVFKKGKKEIPLRPQDVRIDPDFYGSRQKEEREKALYAKFSQNEELKQILLSTNNSLLQKYIPKRKPETDYSLMTIRQRLDLEN
jgi:predicted NAD-dependent protein-ADP-ribosyltransferase YbiA (DUF1768 family)